MKSNLSLRQFKLEISEYRNFRLQIVSTFEPLKVLIHFDKAAVNISALPYIALKSDTAEAHLRNIRSVDKKIDGRSCVYILACEDYSGVGDPDRHG